MIDLEESDFRSTREKIEEFLEAIPDGKAELMMDGIRKVGGIRRTWQDQAGDRLLKRIVDGRPTFLVVSRKTAEMLAKGKEKNDE